MLISQQTFVVFQDVFSVTLFVFQDLLKTSSRRLQDVFAICLPKTSLKRLQCIFKTSCKTSSRRVWKTSCNYVFKASSRRLGRQKNVTLKTSGRHLEDDFSTPSPRQMFAGIDAGVC